jgi:hypothetical protein
MGSDAEPVLQKAMHVVTLKNASGMSPSKEFVTFPALSDDHFLGVASDSSLVFDSAFGSPKQILSLVHAKEVSQALLAEAIRKSKLPSVEVGALQSNSASVSTDVQRTSVPDSSPSEPGMSSRGAKPKAQKRDQGKKRKAEAQVLGPRPNLQYSCSPSTG